MKHLNILPVILFSSILLFGCVKKGENIFTGESLNKMTATINGIPLTAIKVDQNKTGFNETITGEFANHQIVTISFLHFDSTQKGSIPVNPSTRAEVITAYNSGITGSSDQIGISGMVTIDYNSSNTRIVKGTFDFTTQNSIRISNGTYQAINY